MMVGRPRRLLGRAARLVDLEFIRASREARKGFHQLGPGIITGVADDDPSGISTYTVTGASYGYQMLWMSLVTLPMNFAVQVVCARLGLVSGQGLAETIAKRHGRAALLGAVALLAIANVVNIGADIGAIAAAVELLTGAPALLLVVPIGLAIAGVEILMPYARLAAYLKLLTLVVFAYVVGAFFASPDWAAAARSTVVPTVQFERDSLATVAAILGTTISPYLFFWQASEEVEEEQRLGVHPGGGSAAAIRNLVKAANLDVAVGMVMANVGFYFVVLTSAAALHASGITEVKTAADAAEALRPLAGDGASVLFALGIIGTGLLAIPVLAGSLAYATAELFGWPEGLNRPFRRAPQFYGVIFAATLIGAGIVFSPLGEVQALFIAAVVNGIVAPVLLVFVMLAGSSAEVLGEARPGLLIRAVGWATALAMGLVAIATIATSFG
jgi:NRAMP (natural resistance-associated macrophage protein)-like metal ion transporter